MKLLTVFSVGLCLVIASACATRKPTPVTYLIDPACLTQPIKLTGCVPNGEIAEQCGEAKIKYRPGCERIAVK